MNKKEELRQQGLEMLRAIPDEIELKAHLTAAQAHMDTALSILGADCITISCHRSIVEDESERYMTSFIHLTPKIMMTIEDLDKKYEDIEFFLPKEEDE